MPRRAIREFAEELEIPYLLHFTRIDNISSIVEHGLYPVNLFHELDTTPVINDELRLDDHLDGISVSIAFPNSQLFYRFRKDAEEDGGAEWAVFVLDRSILWEKDCAFCRHNAADGRISWQPVSTLKTLEVFQGLFSEIDTYPSRAEQCLKKYDPTDIQAEVLVFDVIEPELIRAIVFNSAEDKGAYADLMGEIRAFVHKPNKRFFASRNYVRKYT